MLLLLLRRYELVSRTSLLAASCENASCVGSGVDNAVDVCLEAHCGRQRLGYGLLDRLGEAVVDLLQRGHAVHVLAAVYVRLGYLVEDLRRRLSTLVEHVDEAIGVARVLGYEDRYVLLYVGHLHAVEVQAQVDREVGVYDVVQIG